MEEGAFVGFRRPETEFYSNPNEWTDITADIDNLAELKIIEYIMRHTWGFKEKHNGKWVCDYDKARKISTDEFMSGRKRQDNTRMDKGTKLSKQSVITGVEKAVKHGYIEVEAIKNEKYYKLKMLPPVKDLDKEETEGVKDLDKEETEGVKDLDKLPVKDLDSTCQEVRQIQARKKETPEIQLQKETLKESTSIRSSFFTSEELRMDTFYCHHYEDPPRLTKKLKGDYDKIAPYVKTQEDMNNLISYTEGHITGDDPRAYPGNLARWVASWQLKREQESTLLPWLQSDNSQEEATEEPDTAIETYAGHPLEYWTEEKMRDAQLTKIQRRTILRLQQEQITLVS